MAPLVAVTIDVHPSDEPTSILRCHDFFVKRNIPVTYLISTAILQKPQCLPAIKSLQKGRHELGTQGHNHGIDEIRALTLGNMGHLAFLHLSKLWFEDVFGQSPLSFRSPSWCGLGAPAVDELARLGYRVDCSATPQRPGILSSLPFANPWMFTPPKPHWLREGLLEIPFTSCVSVVCHAPAEMLTTLPQILDVGSPTVSGESVGNEF